ncbi:MAG: FlgD immunoglobulin-like domain containing protein [Candidatus Eisenbacteria bacterium]
MPGTLMMSRPARPGALRLAALLVICASFATVTLLHPASAAAGGYDLLARLKAEDLPFEEIQISDDLVVYFHQRVLDGAMIEKDYIVYQFDIDSGAMLARKSHWREDLPESLPPARFPAESAGALVGGTIESVRLMVVSPESDVFPQRPAPGNPCWVVKSVVTGRVGLTLVDALDGRILGEGVPPPAAGFTLSGPIYFRPCDSTWSAWVANAEMWFENMGYPTQTIIWPTQEQVMEQVQSDEIMVFYELAHGDFLSFQSGCSNGETAEYTTSDEVQTWIEDSYKKLFAFIGSCDGQCSATSNSFSYEFRKGSRSGTATIGYCGMSEDQCDVCWDYSLDWQNRLFYYMAAGWPIRDAFDQTNADYPVCAGTNRCMRFAGDPEFALTQAQGACCLGSTCQVLATDDCIAAGGEWFPGITGCTPDPCREYVCCLGSDCASLSPFDCFRAEGTLFSDLESCTPGICAWGACCQDQACEFTIAGACSLAEGEWYAATGCDPNPCLPSALGEAVDRGHFAGSRLLSLDALAGRAGESARIVFEVSSENRVPGLSAGNSAAAMLRVRLTVHDVTGRTIRCLADGALTPGTHEASWDGRDERGTAVRTGVYFCCLRVGADQSVGRLLVIR